MVGYIGENSIAQDQAREWFPFYLFPILELLCGREIGSPWIEWRDAEGQLVGRIHIQIRCPSFESGFPALRTGSAEYAGLLLTQAQSSPHIREPWLAGVVRNLLRSVAADLIELRAAFLFLAVDALCERAGVSTQNLSASLDPDTKDQVREVLRDAATHLRDLASAHPDPDQRRSLLRIAERTSGMDQVDRAFGAAVVALLRHHGLEYDAAIAEANYQANRVDSRTWDQALSHWRGIALHGLLFDFESGNYDLELILSTCFHLHDVALRIALSLLAYTGKYQPAVAIEDNAKPLDWVQATTTASELGYDRGYRFL